MGSGLDMTVYDKRENLGHPTILFTLSWHHSFSPYFFQDMREVGQSQKIFVWINATDVDVPAFSDLDRTLQHLVAKFN